MMKERLLCSSVMTLSCKSLRQNIDILWYFLFRLGSTLLVKRSPQFDLYIHIYIYHLYIHIYIYINLLQSSLNCWFPSPSPLPGWLWGFPVRSACWCHVPCPPPSGGRSDSHEISQTWLQGTRGAEMVLGPWGRWARRKVARLGVFF